jgi:hypothetical protein
MHIYIYIYIYIYMQRDTGMYICTGSYACIWGMSLIRMYAGVHLMQSIGGAVKGALSVMPSQASKLFVSYTYTHTHTHTHIYIYIYMHNHSHAFSTKQVVCSIHICTCTHAYHSNAFSSE